jgi:hypothetical protein
MFIIPIKKVLFDRVSRRLLEPRSSTVVDAIMAGKVFRALSNLTLVMPTKGVSLSRVSRVVVGLLS